MTKELKKENINIITKLGQDFFNRILTPVILQH